MQNQNQNYFYDQQRQQPYPGISGITGQNVYGNYNTDKNTNFKNNYDDGYIINIQPIKPPQHQFQNISNQLSRDNLQKQFIRKVLAIILLCLSIAVLITVIAVFSTAFQKFLLDNVALLYVAIALSIITMIAIYCFRKIAKKVPTNYICLFIFVISESYINAFVSIQYSKTAVLIALIVTIGLVAFATFYAWTTKTDITYKVMAMGQKFCFYFPLLIIFLLIFLIAFRNRIVAMIVALALAGFFTFFLVFDIQRLKGKFMVQYEYDDYIIAALDIFIDIMLIFRYILYASGNN